MGMQKTSSHSIKVFINSMPSTIYSNSTSIRKTRELCLLDDIKSRRCPIKQAQALLNTIYTNYSLSRQGNSLDYVLAISVSLI